jgi:hypothetical protein
MTKLTFPALATSVALFASVACAPPAKEAETASGTEARAPTGLWVDATAQVLDSTSEWTNRVELADIDGDGLIDLLFANGGDYSTPGEPEPNRVFLNRGSGERFVERTAETLGSTPDIARVIKARDLNADGNVDIFVGTTYQTQSRLFLGQGGGRFVEVTGTHLPNVLLSVGDAEPGDADGDGDLDLVLSDWGPGNNMTNAGGRTRLWLNDGTGRFTDATADRMPDVLIGFSWDLEFADVDNDHALDILVSCKRCSGSLLFRNDGSGRFEIDRRAIPAYTNNYDFEAMDIDGDGFLDLVTINDGEIVGGSGSSRREHIFINDGEGRFRDGTDPLWPPAANLGEDDNVAAFLDFDSDGDADFVIGSLTGADRLLVNDGANGFRVATEVFSGEDTPGTLGLALADLDRDGRLDVVQAQGEHPTAVQERVFLGSGLAPDTAAPVVSNVVIVSGPEGTVVRARVHDRKSPTLRSEWERVEVSWSTPASDTISGPMRWIGEYLWIAPVGEDAIDVRVCATDAAGNSTCVAAGAS